MYLVKPAPVLVTINKGFILNPDNTPSLKSPSINLKLVPDSILYLYSSGHLTILRYLPLVLINVWEVGVTLEVFLNSCDVEFLCPSVLQSCLVYRRSSYYLQIENLYI